MKVKLSQIYSIKYSDRLDSLWPYFNVLWAVSHFLAGHSNEPGAAMPAKSTPCPSTLTVGWDGCKTSQLG